MAVSEYRQGKWTQKKISKDFLETQTYSGEEIIKSQYRFWPVDRSQADRRFGIVCQGNSVGQDNVTSKARLPNTINTFEISGRSGAPEKAEDLYCPFNLVLKAEGTEEAFLKWFEKLKTQDGLTITFENFYAYPGIFPGAHVLQKFTNVLSLTPERFYLTFPWHESYFDNAVAKSPARYQFSGTWLPFLYHDKRRTFFVRPSVTAGKDLWYYPEVKKAFRAFETIFNGLVYAWSDTLTPGQTKWLKGELNKLPNVSQTLPPTYTVGQMFAALMRMHLFTYCYQVFQTAQFQFKNFYHPFVNDFADLVSNPLQGIPALMSRETQLKNSGFNFVEKYQPPVVMIDQAGQSFYPEEIVDFSPDGAYSPYNWELFFHAPLLIANMLSKNQRFEEARDWYHLIFNPIGVESSAKAGSPMSKYWITKPFFKTTDPDYVKQRIENLLRMLSEGKSGPGQPLTELETQVLDWRTYPFEPNRIANYRTVAYQKTVVMRYLDNLIAWGDYLFRQDSMESISEATQLYILAAEILGPRPKKVPPQVKPPVESFNELENQLDKFANALVQVENLVPIQPGTGQNGMNTAPLPMLYFCIPHNEKILSYWETVADRLYKIRHGMNIGGVLRQLALFEPPIEPGALVKANAAGVDISAALADLNAPLPLYRFNVLLQKANEVCGDVRALGSALLSAIEKKDGEELSLLRQSQEIRLLEAVKGVREKQIEEAEESLESLQRSKAVTEEKREHYRDFQKIIGGEQLSLTQQRTAFRHQQEAQSINVTASMLGYLPNLTFGASGFGGSPHVTVQWGIGNIISALQALAGSEIGLSNAASFEANTALTHAGYTRRFDDAKLQERLAEKEISQVDKQIAAAELRLAIAKKELENHVIQIEDAKTFDAHMRSKYTNEELYQWQIGQISSVFFQSYRLAYDLAKRAERCLRFELGLNDSSFISFGYWDGLKKGLLSGEKLQYDLRRLESAYLEQNRREFELTKSISLGVLDPLALVKLRETGRCFFRLPEELFDLDYPGHYFRRIKSVSLTLPCVAGPYTTVSCTLRLLKNSIRTTTAGGDNGYPRNTDDAGLPADDTRFVETSIPVRAIAASSAQHDSGVFELSFRDDRYLPFEGAGAISDWSLELFSDLPSNNPDPSNPDFGKPLR
ncbi:MAG: toxin [Verrucomicrobiia bacterium]